MHQIKIVLWNYVTTVTGEPERDKNNIITHAQRAVYFSSIRCSCENALGLWLPIISAQLEFCSDWTGDQADLNLHCESKLYIFFLFIFVLQLIYKYIWLQWLN